MPSRVNFFLIIIFSVAVAISAIFFYTTTKDQVNYPVQDSGIFEEVFKYPDVFLKNYALMEKGFKIFMYPNDDADAFFFNDKHVPRVFSNEVFFTRRLMFSERFITNDPTQAHMFFIPITWFQLEGTGIFASADDYVRSIIKEYPYWNQSRGVDHFLVTCCDAGAMFSESILPLNNSLRLTCFARNGDLDHKHHLISIPQMRLPFFPPVPGGYHVHNRTILAFWACHENSPTSLMDWDEYPDQEKFKASKYCICDGSSHITRMCITESIHSGCVPVILYEDYELPFGDILDWTKFSIIINTKDDADRVERILEAIPDSKFNELHNNILKVQRHFHGNPSTPYDVSDQLHLHANSAFGGHDKPYDVFHMIMYELWLCHLGRSFSDS